VPEHLACGAFDQVLGDGFHALFTHRSGATRIRCKFFDWTAHIRIKYDMHMPSLSRPVAALLLLVCANVFMTFAWYGHLHALRDRPLWLAVVASWAIAFFEYCLQVPANRLGYGALSLGQLKIAQEVITMIVFMGFSAFYMKKPVSRDFLYAMLCMGAATYFVFRESPPG
jgi:uncharacterized protein (DUF486 family)